MIARAALVWLGIAALATANGGFRESVLVPRMSETAARAISTLMLSALIVLVAAAALEWITPAPHRDAWRIGVLWVAMTIVFELVAGHYLFRIPWREITGDYNIFKGRIWILVLITTLFAPAIAATWRGRAL
jgi:hypothetical protein